MSLRMLNPQAWRQQQAPFVALWTDAVYAYALYQPADLVAVPLADGAYPALSARHPGAAWFERLAHDLNGATALGALDTRPAVEQSRSADGAGAWPEFAAPAGDGVHQVALGPVYGTITEPAHFRFSVIGERVLKLETRLGYSHRAVLTMIRGKSPRLAARFAARLSGDATVAHSLAFAQAAEAALEIEPPPRARMLRGVMAELERLASHAGSLSQASAAAGGSWLEARFAVHREALCNAAQGAFGHRLMMDLVIPGGVAADIRADGGNAILYALRELEAELPMLTDQIGRRDRLAGVGVIPPDLASAYAAGGCVGRASGQSVDARRGPGYPPYAGGTLNIPLETSGDVAARLRVWLAELVESTRLVRRFLHDLPNGTIAVAPPAGSGRGLGVAESCRGPVWHWLSISGGAIADAFIADTGAAHWPLLEHAAGTAPLADFPLIERSIGASCAGLDL